MKINLPLVDINPGSVRLEFQANRTSGLQRTVSEYFEALIILNGQKISHWEVPSAKSLLCDKRTALITELKRGRLPLSTALEEIRRTNKATFPRFIIPQDEINLIRYNYTLGI